MTTENFVIPAASVERLNRLGISYHLVKLDDNSWYVYSSDVDQSDWYGIDPLAVWEAFIIHLRENLLRQGKITLADWPKIMD